jgi:DNA invertase Pin-like site-specific DNA recombinase
MGLIENTPTGRLILNVLLSFAEFERDMIVERTSEGKAIKRATDPDYKEGRPRKEIPSKFFELLESDVSVAEACKTLGIHRTQWYRWKNEVRCRV